MAEQIQTPVEEHPQTVYQKKKVIFRAYQVIWYILGFVEVLLAFRILLKLLAANPGSTFVNLIYAVSEPLAAPFYRIFRVTHAQGSALEWPTIVGIIVYAIVAVGLVKVMQIVKPASPDEVSRKVDQ